MTDQTEPAGDFNVEHARNTVIDFAARTIHATISTEFGLTPGGEPAVVDVAAAQALARRGLLVPVELFDDREGERAELEEWRSQTDHAKGAWVLSRIREALGTPDGRPVSVHAAEVRAERDLLLWLHAELRWRAKLYGDIATTEINDAKTVIAKLVADQKRLRFNVENTTLPVGALQAMSDAVNLAHPVSEEDDDVPYPELRARRAMDLVYDWLRTIRAIPATLQGDQPAEPTSDGQCQYQIIPGTEPDRRGLCIATATDGDFCKTHAEAMRQPFVPAADAFPEVTDG
ncbi:hypothetical protein ACIBCH_20770 [Amycolatopsis thailandensis]|uniref:hypothetical protein n=1 Tax=Amycolatopsis thailandensis TaxID=589330 RepID=UPI0037966AF7